MDEVDLEALAAGYRHRPPTPASLRRAAAAAGAARLGPGTVAVDVGGGTGHHAAVFAARGAVALVVDRSDGMVRSAAAQPGVSAVRGDAAALPVAGAVCGLVYFHLSLHYGDWRAALDEAVRVARPGGRVWVWTLGEEHHRESYPSLWFPSLRAIDERRFPPIEEIAAHLARAGCAPVETGAAVEWRIWQAGEWRRAVEAGYISTLQLLPLGEREEGLARFSAAHPDPGEPITYALRFRSVSGVRASLR